MSSSWPAIGPLCGMAGPIGAPEDPRPESRSGLVVNVDLDLDDPLIAVIASNHLSMRDEDSTRKQWCGDLQARRSKRLDAGPGRDEIGEHVCDDAARANHIGKPSGCRDLLFDVDPVRVGCRDGKSGEVEAGH